ncbi:AcrR family transcriptional regulator [Hymenobacter luteus]|uniref:AcrR family transcriptional regulator n=2 Tax=Hymenobacter TaxID=89966 RepID=A0A7W9WEA2_9BACT|nr:MULTISPECIES: TetR/AcrR family transcriptional regulator [Hymenobacter]MBB4603622.1 AcrR family transcriptional regulator [Hymenobacter latericoloratus]MBB6061370.1 AcrR family transcriptional regulator [Hymenobacter luteus]
MVTKAQKEEQLRAKVLKVAQQLFQQYGLQKVTMDDVARAIGKGKSTLYYYYKSKEEIFDAVVEHEIKDMLAHLRTALAQADTASAKLETFVLTKLRIMRQKVALYNLLYEDITRHYVQEFSERIRQHYLQTEVLMIKEILQLGVDTAEFKGITDLNLDQVAFVLTSGISGIEQHTLLSEQFGPAEENVKLLSRILVQGLKR